MLQVPVLDRNVPLSIPESRLLAGLGFRSTGYVQQLAKMYLALGGNKERRLSAPPGSSGIATELVSHIEKQADEGFIEAKRNHKTVRGSRVTSVEWNAFVVEHVDGPRLLVGLELPYWYHMSAAWFDHVKSRGDRVYELLAGVLSMLKLQLPVYASPDFIERCSLLDDPMSGEYEPEIIEAAQVEQEGMERLTDAAPKKADIRTQLARVSRKLSRNERTWVKLAIDTIDAWRKIKWREMPLLHNDGLPEEFTDRPDFMLAFMMTYHSTDNPVVEWILEDVNQSYGEYGPPAMFFKVASAGDLQKVVKVIRAFQQLQMLFFSASEVFERSFYRNNKRGK